MDYYDEPEEFYGIPIEQFSSPYLLNQLDPDDIPYLRTIVMCKLYDLHDDEIDKYQAVAESILGDYRGTNRLSQRSAPK